MKAPDPSALTTLDHVPYTENADTFLKAIDLPPSSEYADEALELFTAAAGIAAPKVVYRVCYVEHKTDSIIRTDGIELHSRIMRVNLHDAERLFPFIATCGQELDEWAAGITDPLHRFWADTLRESALRCAFDRFTAHLKATVNPGSTAVMTPGSLEDWPIEEQAVVFRLLGRGPELVGVTLTDSYLMIPTKSIAGVIVPTAKDYVNCKLCPREHCQGRQAPYDPDYYKTHYSQLMDSMDCDL
jgi:hypothetical protein